MSILDGVPLFLAKAGAATPPSLNAPLLCLFFSSQWCPDCVRFVPSLVEAFKGFKPGQADIVFISSDRSEELQRRYMEEVLHADWPAVTFDGEHRADLKRRFGACAGSEVTALGMSPSDRKGGIPTLAVFRASDGVLLTMNGVDDVNQAGAGAVDRWEAAANR
ncbi:conserved unknown protein [Ectocarpus siliculosus]|uniref:Thioredoxin domain-containing protein n=1 Tax=Ectocarpus siliculosus TaxID=2880 RepID=D7FN25_ECTSI|nr:conserved unknown protein [Ectocarpus siliculosus]|eukprot:CBJ30089.1 conserved unknown protein [Ectocarpus siliculosus]